MNNIVCLKCGSKHVDDGHSYVISVLGASLIVAEFIVLFGSMSNSLVPIADWTGYSTVDFMQPAVISILGWGTLMFIGGLHHTERVRCLNCGAVWTAPRMRVAHKRSRPC
jgi:hypothetical protein